MSPCGTDEQILSLSPSLSVQSTYVLMMCHFCVLANKDRPTYKWTDGRTRSVMRPIRRRAASV